MGGPDQLSPIRPPSSNTARRLRADESRNTTPTPFSVTGSVTANQRRGSAEDRPGLTLCKNSGADITSAPRPRSKQYSSRPTPPPPPGERRQNRAGASGPLNGKPE